jgi:hypothetical protein
MSKPEENTSWVGGATNNRQLLRTAQAGLGGLVAYSIYKGWNLDIEALCLALACILLGAWPMLKWLRTQPYPFPAFETFMLTAITAYAMPLLTDHVAVLRYPPAVVLTSLGGVVLFQACALVAFSRTRAIEQKTRFWTEPIFNRDIHMWLHWGLWINTLYIYLHTFTSWIPYDIDSVLRAIFFGIGTASSFLLGRSWGNDELNSRAKFSVVASLAIGAVIQISSLYLINTISSVLVFFLAYISAGKRIPFVPLLCLFVVLTVLHNGKAQMREKYWQEGAPAVQVTDLPDFFKEWVDYGLDPFIETQTTTTKRGLLERASLLHMMCLVVNETDKGVPLLGGESYSYVLPMLVPRFFWPEKPSGQLAVSRLSIHYGLQSEESSRNTSIGFGVLVESYANFGMLGLAALGLLIGFFAKIITTWTRTSPLMSSGGLVMILLMAWALQIELIMAGWVSSLFQACVCMLGIPYAIKKLFN